MDCERVDELLAGRALGKALSANVADHLETCRRCRGELDRVEKALSVLDRELESALGVDVSPGFTALIRQELSVDQPKARERWILRWAAAAVVGIAGIALLVNQLDPPQVAKEESAQNQSPPEMGAAPLRESSPMVPPTTASTTVSRGPSPSVETTIAAPTVLVPPGQEAAILAFHRRSTTGRVVLSTASRRSALEDLPEPSELVIPALEVSPIVLADIRIAPLAGSIDPRDRKQRR